MRKSRYSDEQIAAALRQAEIGTPVADITRKLGISEATFYVWKKRFGTLGTPEIRELRQLRDENAKLKTVVADLTLDRAVLQDVICPSLRAFGSFRPLLSRTLWWRDACAPQSVEDDTRVPSRSALSTNTAGVQLACNCFAR